MQALKCSSWNDDALKSMGACTLFFSPITAVIVPVIAAASWTMPIVFCAPKKPQAV